jgi:hypothetical protein
MDITTVLFIISSGLVDFLFCFILGGNTWFKLRVYPCYAVALLLEPLFLPFFVIFLIEIDSHEQFSGLLTLILLTLALK